MKWSPILRMYSLGSGLYKVFCLVCVQFWVSPKVIDTLTCCFQAGNLCMHVISWNTGISHVFTICCSSNFVNSSLSLNGSTEFPCISYSKLFA
jgi:hypothetical protein